MSGDCWEIRDDRIVFDVHDGAARPEVWVAPLHGKVQKPVQNPQVAQIDDPLFPRNVVHWQPPVRVPKTH